MLAVKARGEQTLFLSHNPVQQLVVGTQGVPASLLWPARPRLFTPRTLPSFVAEFVYFRPATRRHFLVHFVHTRELSQRTAVYSLR